MQSLRFRDWWYDEFIDRSPYRKCFDFGLMPTVDAEPQKAQWLSTYANADGIFAYNDWSGQQLVKEMGGYVNYLGTAPPAADVIFKKKDKSACRDKLGLDDDVFIIGTVMRNQRRKLFDNLFRSFRAFLDKTNKANVFLYCHTSYPDAGWEIPELLVKHGICGRVLFSYSCNHCKAHYSSFFADAIMNCPHCNQNAATTSGVRFGFSEEDLCDLYNSFDLYVQLCNSGAFEMPAVEAAACGVPVAETDYSATSDTVRKLNGFPVALKDKMCEIETGCHRAIPDDNSLIEIFEKSNLNVCCRKRELSKKTLEGYKQHYSYDESAKKWGEFFDTCQGKWNKTPLIVQPKQPNMEIINNKDFVRHLIVDVLGEVELLDTYFEHRMLRDLNRGATTQGAGGYFYNEMAIASARPQLQPFARENAVDAIMAMANSRNALEIKRMERLNGQLI